MLPSIPGSENMSPIRLIGDFSSESTPINAQSLTVSSWTMRDESDYYSPFDDVTINNTMINSMVRNYNNDSNNNNNNNNNDNNNRDNVSATLLRSGLRYPRTPPLGRRTNNNHNNDINHNSYETPSPTPSPNRIRFNIP